MKGQRRIQESHKESNAVQEEGFWRPYSAKTNNEAYAWILQRNWWHYSWLHWLHSLHWLVLFSMESLEGVGWGRSPSLHNHTRSHTHGCCKIARSTAVLTINAGHCVKEKLQSKKTPKPKTRSNYIVRTNHFGCASVRQVAVLLCIPMAHLKRSRNFSRKAVKTSVIIVEAIAIGWRPSLLGWRPSLLGWRR